MTDSEFDAALVSAAFAQAALTGWPTLSIVEAARARRGCRWIAHALAFLARAPC